MLVGNTGERSGQARSTQHDLFFQNSEKLNSSYLFKTSDGGRVGGGGGGCITTHPPRELLICCTSYGNFIIDPAKGKQNAKDKKIVQRLYVPGTVQDQ